MDNSLPRLYREYGQYSNWRNLPSIYDGLKPVERRILLSAFQIARTRLTKSARVDGHVIGNYHPHGSVYGSIVQMVRQGFLDGQGNFGCNIGVEPVGAAASRYTEVKLSKFTEEMAFKNLEFVDWFENDLSQEEPVHLPVKFPMCLLGNDYTQGIGFGFRTFVPCYRVEDLTKRLEWLLGRRQRKINIAPISDCEVLAEAKDLDELLSTGSAKINVRGIIEAEPRTNTAILKSWPPGRKFSAILNKFSAEMDSSSIGFSDLSTTETKIVFKVLRERNRDKIFNDFLKKLTDAVTGTISFEVTVVDNEGNVNVKSIDQLLVETFERYKEVNLRMLASDIKKLQESAAELEILEKIRPHLTQCLRDNKQVDEAVDYITKETGVAKDSVEGLLSKYRIRKLLTLSTDTTDINNEIKDRESKTKEIDNYVLAQYDVR